MNSNSGNGKVVQAGNAGVSEAAEVASGQTQIQQ